MTPSAKISSLPSYRDAALLVAEGRLTETEVAARCGVSSAKLGRWRDGQAFGNLVKEYRRCLWTEVNDGLLCRTARRLALLDRWLALRELRNARGEHGRARKARPELGSYLEPGAGTGLLAPQRHVTGSGTYETWSVDSAVFSEMLELGKMFRPLRVQPALRLPLRDAGRGIRA